MGFCAITGKNYGRVDFSYLTRKDYYCVDCKFQETMAERDCFKEIRRKGTNFFKCEGWQKKE